MDARGAPRSRWRNFAAGVSGYACGRGSCSSECDFFSFYLFIYLSFYLFIDLFFLVFCLAGKIHIPRGALLGGLPPTLGSKRSISFHIILQRWLFEPSSRSGTHGWGECPTWRLVRLVQSHTSAWHPPPSSGSRRAGSFSSPSNPSRSALLCVALRCFALCCVALQ